MSIAVTLCFFKSVRFLGRELFMKICLLPFIGCRMISIHILSFISDIGNFCSLAASLSFCFADVHVLRISFLFVISVMIVLFILVLLSPLLFPSF